MEKSYFQIQEAWFYPLHLILTFTWLTSQPTPQLSIVFNFPFDVAQDLDVVWLQLFSWFIVWLEQGHCCPIEYSLDPVFQEH